MPHMKLESLLRQLQVFCEMCLNLQMRHRQALTVGDLRRNLKTQETTCPNV